MEPVVSIPGLSEEVFLKGFKLFVITTTGKKEWNI